MLLQALLVLAVLAVWAFVVVLIKTTIDDARSLGWVRSVDRAPTGRAASQRSSDRAELMAQLDQCSDPDLMRGPFAAILALPPLPLILESAPSMRWVRRLGLLGGGSTGN